ncbi:MAG: cupin domain-containing protein [Chloroflexi bacterium]|jgi:quercetin dioxygenase-like cupin family protein|nr:cupin domain-containing protein [Chloroflexota bacterium]
MQKFVFDDFFQTPGNKIAKRVIFKDEKVIAFILNIAKGEFLPGHTHGEVSLLLQILDGSATVITDGLETPLEPGELIKVEGNEKVQVVNQGEGTLRLFVTIAPMGNEAFAKDADV